MALAGAKIIIKELEKENAELKSKRTELEDETSDLAMQIVNLKEENAILKQEIERLEKLLKKYRIVTPYAIITEIEKKECL